MVTGQDTDLPTKVMPQHRLLVSPASVGRARQVSAINVDDGTVTKRNQVIYGQARASLVGHPYDVNTVT